MSHIDLKKSYDLTYAERQDLREARLDAELTQGELGELVGLSAPTIGNYENGRSPVGGGTIKKFTEVLPSYEWSRR